MNEGDLDRVVEGIKAGVKGQSAERRGQRSGDRDQRQDVANVV